MRRRHVVGLLTGLLLAAGAAPAQAFTIRWVAPGAPASGACTEAAPCSLQHSATVSQPSDHIRVLPGTYQLSTAPLFDGVTVEGWFPDTIAEPPTILSAPGAGSVLSLVDSGLHDVRLIGTDTVNGALRATNSEIEEVRVEAHGASAEAMILLDGSHVVNSIAASDGTVGSGTVVATGDSSSVGNTTIWTAASAPGLRVTGNTEVDVENTIFDGTTNTVDVTAQGASAQAPATVSLDHSFLVGVAANAFSQYTYNANSSQKPLMVDPGAGAFGQLPQSPTVDYIPKSGNQAARDIDGDLRDVGPARDAGADELSGPPGAATGGVTDLTPTSATLLGTVASGGGRTAYRFQWGSTPAYEGSAEPPRLLVPSIPIFAGATRVLTGLTPGATYHYRVVADNSRFGNGTAAGADATFTTPGGPPPPGATQPPPGGTVPPPRPLVLIGLRVSPSKFRVSSRPTALRAAASAKKPKPKPAPRGAVIQFALSRAAVVKLSIERKRPGRRSGSKCVALKRGQKVSKRTRCTRWPRAGSLRRVGRAGANRVPFSGRLGKRKLALGRYRVSALAADLAGKSKTRQFGFTVVKR